MRINKEYPNLSNIFFRKEEYIGCPTDPIASHDSPNKLGYDLNQSFRSLHVLVFSANTFLMSLSPLMTNTDQDRFFNPPTSDKSSHELPNAHLNHILLT
jgi:hypothetical protein